MEITHVAGKEVTISDELVEIKLKYTEGFKATQEGDTTRVKCGDIEYIRFGDYFILTNDGKKRTVLGDKGTEVVSPLETIKQAYEKVLNVKLPTIPPLTFGGTIKYKYPLNHQLTKAQPIKIDGHVTEPKWPDIGYKTMLDEMKESLALNEGVL